MRELIGFDCTKCSRQTYTSDKNKKKTTGKIELKKYCPFCRAHTVHKESKIAK